MQSGTSPLAIRQYDVHFQSAFLLPSLGSQLPAGRYSVTEETLTFGRFAPQITNYLTIPSGRISSDDIGRTATLKVGELETAIARDLE
jgi:hypothetical protein